MKKLLSLFALFFCCSLLYASPVNRIIFFGDSLSDNGNLYRALSKVIPKSPPYYEGRFSNGPTWSEDLAKYYYDKYYLDSKNYAYGGATALLRLPTPKFLAPTNLELEVDRFLLQPSLKDKSKHLYSIWIGGNDYLFGEDQDPDIFTSRVVEKITWAVNRLMYSVGAKYFLILNLPDMGRIPFGRDGGYSEKMHEFSELHNRKLEEAVQVLRQDNPQATIVYVDIYHLFSDVMDHPDLYNKRFKVNITNTKDACWQGGYMKFRQSKMLSQQLASSLSNQNGHLSAIESTILSDYIMTSPELAVSYALSENVKAMNPCPNANQYLFWDTIHPTEIVHKILSTIVEDRLDAELFSKEITSLQ